MISESREKSYPRPSEKINKTIKKNCYECDEMGGVSFVSLQMRKFAWIDIIRRWNIKKRFIPWNECHNENKNMQSKYFEIPQITEHFDHIALKSKCNFGCRKFKTEMKSKHSSNEILPI